MEARTARGRDEPAGGDATFDWTASALRTLELVREHEGWRSDTLNLVVAESSPRPTARGLLAPDIVRHFGPSRRAHRPLGAAELRP